MKLSMHNIISGKPLLVKTDNRSWLECQGRRVNLGYGWVNIEADWPDVFHLITQDGIATSAELRSDHRSEADFVSRELIMVDVDSGMTIPELLADPFYNAWGAGFYTTPSHTWENHRFRIMFRTETPLTDVTRVRRLNSALLKVYDAADISCKDATRIFYGSPKSAASECRDQVLTDDMVDTLISMIDQFAAERLAAEPEQEYKELSDASRKRIIELLRQSYVGEYPIWRNIGWGLKAGGFSLADFQHATSGMMNQKTPADAKKIWNAASGGSGDRCTMGTVIHFLKIRHGDDCLRLTPEQLADDIYSAANETIKRIKEKIRIWQ